MSSDPTSAVKMEDEGELALLDRVLFRMGMAETDAALQQAVHKFLAPSLLKVNFSGRRPPRRPVGFCCHGFESQKN